MVLYLIGDVKKTDETRARFADAEMVMTELGYTVLNPYCLPMEIEKTKRMRIEFAMMNEAETVCVIDDSPIAKTQKAYALNVGKMVLQYARVDIRRGL